jgi:hypothetical protein
MLASRHSLLLLAFLSAGCVTPKSRTDNNPDEATDLLQRQQLVVEREKQRYAKEYGAFRCAPEAVPIVERHEYD